MKNFVVTISRSYGSGGKVIGKQLAEELGIGYYDREIINIAADDSGISETLFAENDENVKFSLFKSAEPRYKDDIIDPGEPKFVSDDNLFNYQAKAIKRLADTKSCVIVGRCGDYILKDHENVVRIFITAPDRACLRRIMELYSQNPEDAKSLIKSTNKQRSSYYKHYTGNEWNDPKNFDMCLNSDSLGFDGTVQMIKSYIKAKLNIED